jgi:chorismate mutase/prephenate dehydratase
VRVSYFGPENTNTHAAARKLFGDEAVYVPELTKTAVFERVEKEPNVVGVVPIENSTEGVVRETIDGLLRYAPLITREFEMEIVHCLLCHPDADPKKAERILSHTQPLAQCRKYLDKNYPSLPRHTAASTASAAIVASTDQRTLAIANPLAAESLGLKVVDRDIADRLDNATRFICIGKEDAAPTGRDKTSLVFTTPHEKGALLRVLAVFDSANVNLMRIESRPLAERRWEYAFFVDVEGHRLEEPLKSVLAHLTERNCLLKVLGSYPSLSPRTAAS